MPSFPEFHALSEEKQTYALNEFKKCNEMVKKLGELIDETENFEHGVVLVSVLSFLLLIRNPKSPF